MKCRLCKGELTRDEERGCFRCLLCNPIQAKPVEQPKDEGNYVDTGTKWTEEKIRALIRDELENWHIQKPPVTAKEIAADVVSDKTWRDKAKEMGVSLYDHDKKCPRKKTDVLEDMKKAG